MEIFQIWTGEPPEKRLQDAMRCNMRLGDYTLISDTNFLNVGNWIDIKEYEWLYKGKGWDAKLKSDVIRFYYAKQRPVFYADCDCRIISLPILKKKAYFVRKHAMLFDLYAFYSGDAEFFEDLFASIIVDPDIMTPLIELNKRQSGIKSICKEFFEHPVKGK